MFHSWKSSKHGMHHPCSLGCENDSFQNSQSSFSASPTKTMDKHDHSNFRWASAVRLENKVSIESTPPYHVSNWYPHNYKSKSQDYAYAKRSQIPHSRNSNIQPNIPQYPTHSTSASTALVADLVSYCCNVSISLKNADFSNNDISDLVIYLESILFAKSFQEHDSIHIVTNPFSEPSHSHADHSQNVESQTEHLYFMNDKDESKPSAFLTNPALHKNNFHSIDKSTKSENSAYSQAKNVSQDRSVFCDTVYFISLDLSENNLTCAGIVKLSNWFKQNCSHVRLRLLKIYKNHVADIGVAAIAELILAQPSALEELHLSHNRITDKGVIILFKSFSHAQKKNSEVGSHSSSVNFIARRKQTPANKSYIYPRNVTSNNSSRSMSTVANYLPVWIRLEYNCISDTMAVLQQWETDCKSFRNYDSFFKLACFAERLGLSKGSKDPHCSPARCLRASSGTSPLLHLYSFYHQSASSQLTHLNTAPVSTPHKSIQSKQLSRPNGKYTATKNFGCSTNAISSSHGRRNSTSERRGNINLNSSAEEAATDIEKRTEIRNPKNMQTYVSNKSHDCNAEGTIIHEGRSDAYQTTPADNSFSAVGIPPTVELPVSNIKPHSTTLSSSNVNPQNQVNPDVDPASLLNIYEKTRPSRQGPHDYVGTTQMSKGKYVFTIPENIRRTGSQGRHVDVSNQKVKTAPQEVGNFATLQNIDARMITFKNLDNPSEIKFQAYNKVQMTTDCHENAAHSDVKDKGYSNERSRSSSFSSNTSKSAMECEAHSASNYSVHSREPQFISKTVACNNRDVLLTKISDADSRKERKACAIEELDASPQMHLNKKLQEMANINHNNEELYSKVSHPFSPQIITNVTKLKKIYGKKQATHEDKNIWKRSVDLSCLTEQATCPTLPYSTQLFNTSRAILSNGSREGLNYQDVQATSHSNSNHVKRVPESSPTKKNNIPLYIFPDASAFSEMRKLEKDNRVNLFSFPGMVALCEKQVICHNEMVPVKRSNLCGSTEEFEVLDDSQSLILMIVNSVEEGLLAMTEQEPSLLEAIINMHQDYIGFLGKHGVVEAIEGLDDKFNEDWRYLDESCYLTAILDRVPIAAVRVMDFAFLWAHQLAKMAESTESERNHLNLSSKEGFTDIRVPICFPLAVFVTNDPVVEQYFQFVIAHKRNSLGNSVDCYTEDEPLICLSFDAFNELLRSAFPNLSLMLERSDRFQKSDKPYLNAKEILSASGVRALLVEHYLSTTCSQTVTTKKEQSSSAKSLQKQLLLLHDAKENQSCNSSQSNAFKELPLSVNKRAGRQLWSELDPALTKKAVCHSSIGNLFYRPHVLPKIQLPHNESSSNPNVDHEEKFHRQFSGSKCQDSTNTKTPKVTSSSQTMNEAFKTSSRKVQLLLEGNRLLREELEAVIELLNDAVCFMETHYKKSIENGLELQLSKIVEQLKARQRHLKGLLSEGSSNHDSFSTSSYLVCASSSYKTSPDLNNMHDSPSQLAQSARHHCDQSRFELAESSNICSS